MLPIYLQWVCLLQMTADDLSKKLQEPTSHLKVLEGSEGYQVVVPQDIPSPATAGSSQQVFVQRAGGDPLKTPLGEF